MLSKHSYVVSSTLLLLLLLDRPPSSLSDCPYSCLPPPTQATNCLPPPSSEPVWRYPPPPDASYYGESYPPPLGYIPYFPPPDYTLPAPPPPNSILPWFPFYYRTPPPSSAAAASTCIPATLLPLLSASLPNVRYCDHTCTKRNAVTPRQLTVVSLCETAVIVRQADRFGVSLAPTTTLHTPALSTYIYTTPSSLGSLIAPRLLSSRLAKVRLPMMM
ncbi:hypothetical protein B296_00056258 [Ensete ventricosum]|uniref:Extensin domain-containing protein n=1 Tax=Ensete ventricosum TaxID=4639 RepID=A0A426X9P4_ENSVE|nr:hypothetical protein B296_00056258 [Ensete ventricosum]